VAKANLPQTLPGNFFVIVYDTDYESFVLVVDDEDHSSYRIGAVENAMCILSQLQVPGRVLSDALDVAREFGSAQAIPSQDRVIPIYDRRPVKNALASKGVGTHGNRTNFWPNS